VLGTAPCAAGRDRVGDHRRLPAAVVDEHVDAGRAGPIRSVACAAALGLLAGRVATTIAATAATAAAVPSTAPDHRRARTLKAGAPATALSSARRPRRRGRPPGVWAIQRV
jgi:hypothetical protein